jgi:predicted nucleotidyltransferase
MMDAQEKYDYWLDIAQYDLETVKTVAKNYADDARRVMPVDRAVLYGSYAKGSATEYSDVDICFSSVVLTESAGWMSLQNFSD